MNEWNTSNLRQKFFTEKQWFTDNTFVGYNDQYVFIFKNAINNEFKRKILLEVFDGLNELVNVTLNMIGFELYGSWLCHNIGLYQYRQSRNKRKCLDNTD